MADHFSAILYLLAPLYWLWDNPKILLIVQTISLGIGALPVYLIAKQRLSSSIIALLFGFAYLLYPSLQWTNTFDFHPEVLITSVLISIFYFLYNKKWFWYFLFLVFTSLSKETAGFTIAMIGIYALFLNKRIGIATIGLGIISICIAFSTIHYFNHGEPSAYISYYANYGDNLKSIIIDILKHPIVIFDRLQNDSCRIFILNLLQPVVFLHLLPLIFFF